MNLRLEIVESEEGPALGAAILAAVGCGAYPDVETAASRIVKVIDTVEPQADLVCKYEKKISDIQKNLSGRKGPVQGRH